MKILLCTFWTLPHTGGINTYVHILKNELEKSGHEVDVFAHHPSYDYYYLMGQELRIEKAIIWKPIFTYINTYYNNLFPQIDPWIIEMEAEKYSFEAACSTLNLEEYHIIHAQDVISSAALSRIKPNNPPIISTIHGWFVNEYYLDHPNSGKESLPWIYNQYIEHYGVSNSQLTLLPSKWLRDIYIKDFHIPPQQLIHVPYGIETDHLITNYSPLPKHQSSQNVKVLSCIARLVPVKGHKYLIEALSMLKKERSDWICNFIGDGPLQSDLELLGKQLGIDQHLRFVGARNDVQSWLQQTDIVVLTSIQDNQPFAVMEAQLSGRPVIVTNAGGMPEMVEHLTTGLIAEIASAESIYSNISMLMDNEDLRIKLGNAGRTWALDRWSIDNMVIIVNSIYKQMTLHKKEGNTMNVKKHNDTITSIKSVYPHSNENLFNEQDLETWKKIIPNLPQSYKVPDPNIVKLIHKSTK